MSPQTKKAWSDSTLYLKRLGISVLCFISSWAFYQVVDYVQDIKKDVGIILQREAARDVTEREQDRFNVRVQNAVDANAKITEIHTGQIIKINAKLGIE